MSDDLPELPSDEELGIAGMSEDDLLSESPGTPEDGSGSSDPREASDPTPPRRPEPGWRGPLTLLLLLASVLAGLSRWTLPAPAPANAPEEAFSSARAMATIADIARSPRPPGSSAHERVRSLLVSRLQDAGFQVELQEVTHARERGETAVAVTVRNIVARRAGTASTGAVLLAAHYDSRPQSPGAGDDATGVAVLLETVRALGDELPLTNDLIVLLSDGEEYGLHGARAFVDDHPLMEDVRLVLNVEMRGARGPSLMFQTGEQNGWVAQQVAAADPAPVANSLFVEIYRRLPNDTDFTPFLDAGVQGLNFAAIGGAEHYHQASDTPENLSEATVQHHGLRILALTRHLGDQDLSVVDAPDRSFVPVPFVGLVTIPRVWAWPVTLGILGGILLVTFVATLRGARTRGIVLGAFQSVLAVAASAAAGWLIFRWAAPLHAEVGALTPAFHDEVPYRWALAFIALAVTLGLFEAARPWVRPLEAALGALLLPALSLAAMTLVAPAAALNLQLPLAAAVSLLLVMAITGLHKRRGWVGWVLTLLITLPVIVFLTPLAELMAVALGMRAAPVLAGLMTLFLLMVLPALEWLETPNRWWAPFAGLVVGLGFLAWGAVQAAPSEGRPAPSTLIHTLSRDAAGAPLWARWVTQGVPSEGLEWAETALGSRFVPDSAGLLEGFLLPDRRWLIHEAPVPSLAPPRVVVLRDAVVAGERRVRLGILSRAGAESIAVTAPDGVSFQGVAGTPVSAADLEALGPSVRVLVHWGRTEPDLTVTLAGPAGVPWEMAIVERFEQPSTALPASFFERPPSLIPDVTVASDRMLVRTPYTVGDATLAAPWSSPGDSIAATGVDDVEGGADPEPLPDSTTVPDSLVLPDSTGGAMPAAGGDSAIGGAAPSPGDTSLRRDTVGAPDTLLIPDSTGVPGPDSALVPDTTSRREVGLRR